MATVAASPGSVSFQFLQTNNAVLSCIFSVLKCLRPFCMSADTSNMRNKWHIRTWKQKVERGGRSLSICDCQAALISCKQRRSLSWPLTVQRGTRISKKMQKQSGNISTKREESVLHYTLLSRISKLNKTLFIALNRLRQGIFVSPK